MFIKQKNQNQEKQKAFFKISMKKADAKTNVDRNRQNQNVFLVLSAQRIHYTSIST